MKYITILALALVSALATPIKRSNPLGIDVSGYQTSIDWTSVANNGIQFVYIEATEGTSYISPEFNSQYTGAANAGLIRGSYHFAHPDESTGGVQAQFFLAHGGGWSADGVTLPGALDIEYNPDGADCYGLTASEMVSWIKDFSDTYESSTGRYPVIYTTTDWWSTCTGNSASFANNNPLWIANWAAEIGSLPAGWEYASFWQYASGASPNPGDADLWNGDYSGLQKMARGS